MFRHTLGMASSRLRAEVPPFSLDVRRRGDAAVVEVRGDLDTATAGHLCAQLQDVVVRQGNRVVVVDLTDMTFIDARGVSVLAKAYQQARARGGELHIQHPSPMTARVLQITGLGRLLLGRGDSDC